MAFSLLNAMFITLQDVQMTQHHDVGLIAKLLACKTTGSAQAAASDIHRQLPTHMADLRRDWLTNQNTD